MVKLINLAGSAVRLFPDGRKVRAIDGQEWPSAGACGEEIEQAEFDLLVEIERGRQSVENCRCFRIDGLGRSDREVPIGRDEQRGRFGEVTLQKCGDCGRKWLEYFVEYEAFTASGRRFRGLVTDAQAATVTASTAATMLGGLPWHFAWGSYFDGRWLRQSGPVRVDL
jgi:hypothetical protein